MLLLINLFVERQHTPSEPDAAGLNCGTLSLQDVRRPVARRSAGAALCLTFSIFELHGLCHFAYWLGNLFFVVGEFFELLIAQLKQSSPYADSSLVTVEMIMLS